MYAAIALVISILGFYWCFYPAIKGMDKNGQVTPAGYSITLGRIIAVILSVFVVAVALSILFSW